MAKKRSSKVLINNDFYDHLEDGWYTAKDHPVVLLRKENEVRVPWIIESIQKRRHTFAKVLDMGCGAGFLCNPLVKAGHDVTGVDLSKESLVVAEKFDSTKRAKYLYADAMDLPFPDESFDVVCAMDILEHVEKPEALIKEASRVLKPKGLFFFHTFNKNFLSYLVIIKGVEWFIKNVPPNMHVYHLFLSPKELKKHCLSQDLFVDVLRGFRPKINFSFFKLLGTKNISQNFCFTFSKRLHTGYCGIATKK